MRTSWNGSKTELVNFVKLLMKSEFFRALFSILTGKDNEEDLISLFLLSWDEEEALRGKSFEDCYDLILPLIITITELGFIDDEYHYSSWLPEKESGVTFH